jgi:hypothetical protein
LRRKSFIAKAWELTFPVYKDVEFANGRPLDVDGTPETLIVSQAGAITQRWLGAYGGNIQKQIEQTFRIHLPGMTTETSDNEYTTAGAAPKGLKIQPD